VAAYTTHLLLFPATGLPPSLPFPPKQIKKGPCGKQQRSTKRGKKALLPFLFFFLFILFYRRIPLSVMDGLGKILP